MIFSAPTFCKATPRSSHFNQIKGPYQRDICPTPHGTFVHQRTGRLSIELQIHTPYNRATTKKPASLSAGFTDYYPLTTNHCFVGQVGVEPTREQSAVSSYLQTVHPTADCRPPEDFKELTSGSTGCFAFTNVHGMNLSGKIRPLRALCALRPS